MMDHQMLRKDARELFQEFPRLFSSDSTLRGVCSVCELEGFAVHALRLGRVRLVSRDSDLVQSAVVFVFAVMSALMNAALDAVVCTFLFHNNKPPLILRLWRRYYYF